MGVTVTGGSADPVPVGKYIAQFMGASEKSGQYGPMIQWNFQIVDSNYPHLFGMTTSGISSTKASPGSKLYKWLQKGFGIELAPGQQFSMDQLDGRYVRVKIEENGEYTNVVALAGYDPAIHGGVMAEPPQAQTLQTPPQQQPTQQPQAQTLQTPPQQQAPPVQQSSLGVNAPQSPVNKPISPGELSPDEDIDF